MTIRHYNKGFTLAEVLVTLSIIGIIAALTIPSLVQNVQNEQHKSAWKKIYSEISLATINLANDNGGTIKGLSYSINAADFLRNLYGTQLKYIKTCNNDGWACWSPQSWYAGRSLGSYATPEDLAKAIGNDSGAILANGAVLNFRNYISTCSPVCGSLAVDVNGFKPPNEVGQDIFEIRIYENYIKPYGFNTTPTCPAGSGWDCSMVYLLQ